MSLTQKDKSQYGVIMFYRSDACTHIKIEVDVKFHCYASVWS